MKRDRAVGEADCCQAGGVEQRGTGLKGPASASKASGSKPLALLASGGRGQTVHRSGPNRRNASPRILRHLLPFLVLVLIALAWWLGGDGSVDLTQRLAGPSCQHPFGTDELGRDLLQRFLLGGARSITLGLLITALNLATGLLLALLCHPLPALRRALLALADLLASIPAILLALLLLAMLRPGMTSLVAALSVGGWIAYARLAMNRLDVLTQDASLLQVRLMGGGRGYTMIHHLLRRLWPLLGTQAAIGIGAVVLVEGGLSFLGVGLPPELASWGTMLASGRTFLLVSPWGLLWPALGLLGVLLATDFTKNSAAERHGC